MTNDNLEQAISVWKETTPDYSGHYPVFSQQEKLQNEQKLDALLDEIAQQLEKLPNTLWPKMVVKNKVISYFQSVLDIGFPYSFSNFDGFLKLGFFDMTVQFFKHSFEFDASLPNENIFQGLRNVWVMGALQGLFGQKIKLTPAVFSYSLLYPYSDNYIDDALISYDEKLAFSQRFKGWVFGKNKDYANPFEKKMTFLTLLLHKAFPVEEFPEVYEKINDLFTAQSKSLLQQHTKISRSIEEILSISFEKGGITVLTDEKLIQEHSLTKDEEQTLYKYGTVFQMIDDLQDIKEDTKSNSDTLFTQLDNPKDFDEAVCRLKNFVIKNNENSPFKGRHGKHILAFIHDASFLLIDIAISENQENFSKVFLDQLESYYPVRLDYLARFEEKIIKTLGEDGITNLINTLG